MLLSHPDPDGDIAADDSKEEDKEEEEESEVWEITFNLGLILHAGRGPKPPAFIISSRTFTSDTSNTLQISHG